MENRKRTTLRAGRFTLILLLAAAGFVACLPQVCTRGPRIWINGNGQVLGHQLSKVMLLSDQAEIDAKPELEIYADDVKCSHGATAGDLDHDALFYLRSRGLSEARAHSLLIEAYPIDVVNVMAAGIHAYYLRKLIRRKHEVFDVLHVHPDSRYLAYFLDYYRDEITARFQPDFVYEEADNQFAAFILRDVVPAGLFIGRVHPDESIEAVLDFVIPQYRDFKIAPYLYSERSGLLTGTNCRRVWSVPGADAHAAYLRRVGFREEPTAEHAGRFVLELSPASAGG